MRAIFVLLVVALFAILGASANQCGENEEFQRCGTACERTCTNGDEWENKCEKPCVDKCFCKDGFLRDDTNGACVRAWRCSGAL